MEVIERATMPNGIEIQLENWRENNTPEYPDLYGLVIAAYPVAQRSSGYWIKGGEKFRLHISTNRYLGYTNEMVKADFDALKSGEKRLEDLSEHFWNGKKDAYILGMNI